MIVFSIIEAKCSGLEAKSSDLEAKCSDLEARCSDLEAKCSDLEARCFDFEAYICHVTILYFSISEVFSYNLLVTVTYSSSKYLLHLGKHIDYKHEYLITGNSVL